MHLPAPSYYHGPSCFSSCKVNPVALRWPPPFFSPAEADNEIYFLGSQRRRIFPHPLCLGWCLHVSVHVLGLREGRSLHSLRDNLMSRFLPIRAYWRYSLWVRTTAMASKKFPKAHRKRFYTTAQRKQRRREGGGKMPPFIPKAGVESGERRAIWGIVLAKLNRNVSLNAPPGLRIESANTKGGESMQALVWQQIQRGD